MRLKEDCMGKWEGLNRRKFPRVNYPCLVVIRKSGQGGEDEKDNVRREVCLKRM